MIKQQLSPGQVAVILGLTLLLVIGIGCYFTFGVTKTYPSMPAAHSRADMLSAMHASKRGVSAPSPSQSTNQPVRRQ